MKTQKRKLDHLQACLTKDVGFRKPNGFERYELVSKALPEMSPGDVDTSASFLGKPFRAPVFIEAMTGGTALAGKINRNLAKAAQDLGLGMGVGSQRAMIEDPKLTRTYQVRDAAPDIFLAGNIGATQIKEFGVSRIVDAVDRIGADALVIHLNPAQEIAQDDGHVDWKGVLESIKRLRSGTRIPLIVKEVGCGISGDVARSLEAAGVIAIDVAGAGGTSWIKVDSLITGKPLENLFDWGIPTAVSLEQCARSVRIPLIASGGIRSGVEAAKALAMGASLVGMALPLLKPATKSSEAVKAVLEKVTGELEKSMFLVGARNLKELKGKVYRI
jgi:isopentenyl-diphosphate delta-isomerase